jgi:hypothetical protein
VLDRIHDDDEPGRKMPFSSKIYSYDIYISLHLSTNGIIVIIFMMIMGASGDRTAHTWLDILSLAPSLHLPFVVKLVLDY